MKKIFAFILSTSILMTSFITSVSAEEVDNNIMSNVQEAVLNEESGIKVITYYSQEDAIHYLVKVYENRIEVYNDDSNVLITRAEITKHEAIVSPINIFATNDLLRAGADDYEKWGAYAKYKTETFHINDIESLTLSTVAGMLSGWLGFGMSAAIAVYNNKYKDLYADLYMSTNVYCSILVKEKYELYKVGDGTHVTTEYRGPSWWGSPWDYSQPAACRVLAERY